MAKLADAADLKSAGRKAVGVQVPLRAPINLDFIDLKATISGARIRPFALTVSIVA